MGSMNTPTANLDSRDFARIAAAIAYIDANFRAQPRLASIAAAAHLSEFHFNRLFRRWAGVTPRQYLAFVTARAARGALLGSRSVLDAAYAVGLSGPGRLHDLMVTLEAVTPGELKSLGGGLTLTTGFAHTPFGRALLASTARGLSHLSFVEPGGDQGALRELSRQWPGARLRFDDGAAQQLADSIWSREAAGAPVRLAVKGTNFQLKVWRALLQTATHEPTTYGELARVTGRPAAARAVGAAVGANPVAWLIPCHNVLRASGELGGYHWGAARKRAMLSWQSLRRPQVRVASAPRSRQAT
ncbi:MAG: bifunctional helix-turn-helix domain-containing protein/methylated-DNA--[protein]-cysteine S-methyltransferase [Proteobacteria bacterium]|nr:bifunctional helix-turn-helix domain-containing protein/methylated-DNA--[protein]-cysteine S-methyltransferase [Pseudomonadota bacterium]